MRVRTLQSGSRATTLAILASLSVGAVGAASAEASRLPKALAATRWDESSKQLLGVYRVRPKRIQMIEAAGGTLRLHWRRWSSRSARARGTSTVNNMGGTFRTRIRVKLRRPRDGYFLRMTIVFFTDDGKVISPYRLGTQYGSPTWVDTENCGDPDLDAVCF